MVPKFHATLSAKDYQLLVGVSVMHTRSIACKTHALGQTPPCTEIDTMLCSGIPPKLIGVRDSRMVN